MYSDEDGVASKQSEAVYKARVKVLSLTTCLLSFVGFGASVIKGEYARETLTFSLSLETLTLLENARFLWVRYLVCCLVRANLPTSPSCHLTALAFSGKITLSSSIIPV
jgi:hypothetical protein